MSSFAAEVWARRAQTMVRIVDAHAHAGPFSLFHIPDADAASMVRVMDRCGVALAVFSSHQAIQLDGSAGNDETAAAVSRYPHRLLGYLTVNPWQDPVAELARWGGDRRFGGIKLHPDLHLYPITGPRYGPVWDFAAETGVPVLSHTGPHSAYNDLTMIEAIAEAHPEVTVLAGHAGGAPDAFELAIQVARRHPSVVLEVCGSRHHGDALLRMVEEVGSSQVVFGSDFPFIDLRSSLGRVMFARIGEDDRAAVLGGTMTRLLDRSRTRNDE